MKNTLLLLCFMLLASLTQAQTFPGLTAAQKAQLQKTKIAIPLPTWIPAGFKVTSIITRTAKVIPIEERNLSVTYTRKLANKKIEGFTVEAGFEGIGSMGYDGITVKSKVGNIILYYEPMEELDGGKKEKVTGLVQTEWFDIKDVAFHVVFALEPVDDKKESDAVITSLPNAKKILASMQVLR